MTTLSGGPRKTDFQDGEILTAAGFNEATRFWLADDVPDETEGKDGDVVFVVGDAVGGGELPGIGGWATITEVSGTYTKYPYGDWVAYEWTADGTVTTTDGLLDVFMISAGGGSRAAYGSPGNGGDVRQGLTPFTDDVHDVIVGQPVINSGDGGQPSSIGIVRTIGAGPGQPYGAWGAGGKADPPPGNWQGYQLAGIKSTITGVEYNYGHAGRHTNYGDGAPVSTTSPGKPGVVIVRVPAANAENVTENFFRWISYATVENGVVTKVTKTPDNQPYTASADEVECDASVQEGYLYENGEFTAPEPDYSEEIEALTARLEELRNG